MKIRIMETNNNSFTEVKQDRVDLVFLRIFLILETFFRAQVNSNNNNKLVGEIILDLILILITKDHSKIWVIIFTQPKKSHLQIHKLLN